MKCGERMRCRSCNRERTNHGRGLCYSCSRNPAVRERFPSQRPVPSALALYETSTPALREPVPTHHPPGTAGKLAVLEARAAAGERLWHPDDATELDAATVPGDLLDFANGKRHEGARPGNMLGRKRA